jgi:hypothetical protein
MAFSKVFLSKNLQLKLNTGLDENFNPIYKTRTWANVKANATDEDLFELAEEIGSLQVHTLEEVRTGTLHAIEED